MRILMTVVLAVVALAPATVSDGDDSRSWLMAFWMP